MESVRGLIRKFVKPYQLPNGRSWRKAVVSVMTDLWNVPKRPSVSRRAKLGRGYQASQAYKPLALLSWARGAGNSIEVPSGSTRKIDGAPIGGAGGPSITKHTI